MVVLANAATTGVCWMHLNIAHLFIFCIFHVIRLNRFLIRLTRLHMWIALHDSILIRIVFHDSILKSNRAGSSTVSACGYFITNEIMTHRDIACLHHDMTHVRFFTKRHSKLKNHIFSLMLCFPHFLHDCNSNKLNTICENVLSVSKLNTQHSFIPK